MRSRAAVCTWFVLAAGVLASFSAAKADDEAIHAAIHQFLAADEPTAALDAARSAIDAEGFDRARLNTYLHAAADFEARKPDTTSIRAEIPDAGLLSVTLRIPAGYDPAKPWPLIYALHGTGGDGAGIIQYVETILGERVDGFIVAAPENYQQVAIMSTTPVAAEHQTALTAIKREAHIDSDRVYALGYSRGGHACWTLALTMPQEFAGVVPVAGTFLIPEYDHLFETFLPNARHLPILNCWGADDRAEADNTSRSKDGGIAGLNRKLRRIAEQLEVPVSSFEDPDKGHGGIVPPSDQLAKLLATPRQAPPQEFEHIFRVLRDAKTAWLEAHEWTGKQWSYDEQLSIKSSNRGLPLSPADQRAALARAIRQRLGLLQGAINGQEIRIRRKNVNDLTLWLTDGMIDWTQPVTVKLSGRTVFEGELTPDPVLAIVRAKQTRDFDRLWFAGLRIPRRGKAEVLTPEMLLEDWLAETGE